MHMKPYQDRLRGMLVLSIIITNNILANGLHVFIYVINSITSASQNVSPKSTTYP